MPGCRIYLEEQVDEIPPTKSDNGITATEFQRYGRQTYVDLLPLIYCALRNRSGFYGVAVSKVNSVCHIALGRALEQLETAMKQEGVWPKKMPSEQDLKNAMESSVPFAVGCLAFESWLAFIFIPKMRILLTQEKPLPTMQIAPAAEIYLSSAHQRTLSQLQIIDNITNEDIG